MNVVYLILYILAVVCFVAGAFDYRFRNVSLVALGLAFATAVPLIQVIHRM